jgi:hypothetical protein
MKLPTSQLVLLSIVSILVVFGFILQFFTLSGGLVIVYVVTLFLLVLAWLNAFSVIS